MNNLGPVPRLQTERLILRPFCLYDAKPYFELATDSNIIHGTDMPHDLDITATNDWIISHSEAWQQRRELYLLITSKESRNICGSISLFTYDRHSKADIGYWISFPQWGQGYATEAASVVIKYAFEMMKLNKLEANHLLANPTSGRVLEKLGFKYEGYQRQGYYKDSLYQDLLYYGLLQSEFFSDNTTKSS